MPLRLPRATPCWEAKDKDQRRRYKQKPGGEGGDVQHLLYVQTGYQIEEEVREEKEKHGA